MSNDTLLRLLQVFKEARLSIASRISSEAPDLFRDLFKFEGNIEILSLVIEREYILWIDKHFELFDREETLKEDASAVSHFQKTMVELIGHRMFKGSSCNNLVIKELCLSLLNEKIEILNELIKVSDITERRYQRLVYSYEKDKRLFERAFRDLA
ncbi:MAG: hypothetical protein F6K00_31555 [Leptolyngbya sp. SIOISBB]|nr:hypothetical protein [Leptolyngbya sp. SIOISBB]